MNLSPFNDHYSQSLVEYMKQILSVGETNLLDFGELLRGMGKLEDAEKYYLRLLNQLPDDHEDIHLCYFQLGRVANDRDDCESSLEWYQWRREGGLRGLQPP